MQRYETIFIIDPDLSEEGRAPVVERLLQLIPQQNGVLVEQDHWGARKLAYPIRKKQRGYYLRLDYCGGGTLVDELERFCRIDDRMLKYMTIKLADEVDVDQVRAEMAERAAAKAAAEAGEPSGDREEDAEEDRSDDENDVDENDDEEDDKE
jgi:small subunit ribosomal protein S6